MGKTLAQHLDDMRLAERLTSQQAAQEDTLTFNTRDRPYVQKWYEDAAAQHTGSFPGQTGQAELDRRDAALRKMVGVVEYPPEGIDAAPVDPVNHPPHYTAHPSGVECIQITEHMGFCLGNAVKYIWRADLKHDAVEDLKKARWYLDREIAKRTAGGQP